MNDGYGLRRHRGDSLAASYDRLTHLSFQPETILLPSVADVVGSMPSARPWPWGHSCPPSSPGSILWQPDSIAGQDGRLSTWRSMVEHRASTRRMRCDPAGADVRSAPAIPF